MISIITPVFNRVSLIDQAIESVVYQEDSLVEHIIIDGGSTDGTLDILSKYPHLKIVSEPDQGMYDAINRGLELAQGNIIGFLNSDDIYVENIFSKILQVFNDEQILAVVGEAIIFSEMADGTLNIRRRFSPESFTSLLELTTKRGPFFNAWFFRKSLFEKIGNFNTHYRIAGDREFMLRFALSGLQYTKLNYPVYKYRQHSGSMTFGIKDQMLDPIYKEHIFMTRSILEHNNLSKQGRNLIRDLHTRNTLDMAFRSLKKINLCNFTYYFHRGLKIDAFWFLKFVLRAGRAIKTQRQQYQEKPNI